jgi:hypothetical protein
MLRDAVEEAPGEAKRFPQALWDAVGDLSVGFYNNDRVSTLSVIGMFCLQVTVELQDMLEGPLAGPDGDEWKRLPREMPEQYEKWVDAQIYSEIAANKSANFKDIIRPLESTKRAPVLATMWKYINSVSLCL